MLITEKIFVSLKSTQGDITEFPIQQMEEFSREIREKFLNSRGVPKRKRYCISEYFGYLHIRMIYFL